MIAAFSEKSPRPDEPGISPASDRGYDPHRERPAIDPSHRSDCRRGLPSGHPPLQPKITFGFAQAQKGPGNLYHCVKPPSFQPFSDFTLLTHPRKV
jgi:hypothetical protein